MAEEIARWAGSAALDVLLGRMGDLVAAVWDFSLGLVVNLILLPRNAQNLDEEMERLQEQRHDLRNRAEQEARATQNEVSQQLSGWINRVDTLRSEVTRFQQDYEGRSICITGICVGYNAAQLLRRVNMLTGKGNALTQLVGPRCPGAVEEVPLETSSSSMVGVEETLRRIQGHILDTGVGIIGIYGMGGIGKTTLLQIINNEFLQGEEARGLFDVAIWVTVSRDVDILGIQKAIGDRVALSLSDDDPHRQAKALFSELSKKRFILLLDDMWEKLDLVKVGIPSPKNANVNRKILFTTRSKQVCNQMDADGQVEVSLLDDKGSWTLFQSKLSTEAVPNGGDIQQLAKQVVTRCGGLPISLITVGRAMADATTPNEWRHAINALDRCATELSGMETVLASLKFSFDMLKDDILRSCLLYCALFPEDYNIPKRRIIDYWVCEGLLDPENSEDSHVDDTRDRGHARIRDLQNACLLEVGRKWNEEIVRLHDTVRDMALWIAERQFVVLLDHTGRAGVPRRGRWENATMISVEGRMIPSGRLNCPNLTTLLLCFGSEKLVPVGLFTDLDTPALRVLDLSTTTLEKFPIEITSLIQLQYLSLANTGITHVPKELGNLVNLRQLYLSLMASGLWSIPQEAISRLTSLQVLDMRYSGYVFDREARRPQQLTLSDLENLTRLCELSLDAISWHSLEKIVHSDLLRDCVKHLRLSLHGGCPSGTILSERIGNLSNLRYLTLRDDPDNPVGGALGFRPDQLPNLESFNFYDFTKVTSFEIRIPLVASRPNSELAFGQPAIRRIDGPLFQRLRVLTIGGCRVLMELTWVSQLPSLQIIHVAQCDGVTEVLLPDGGGLPHDDSFYFPELKEMHLSDLPALRRISTRPLLFPSLEWLFVLNCPCLKQLAFGPESARKIKQIDGEQDWWDWLMWDNCPDGRSVKSNFLAFFKAVP